MLVLSISLLSIGVGGSIGVLGAAMALGIRHGIDWDHIAAITDITSTAATIEHDGGWLTSEPGVMLTDESHHAPMRVAVGSMAAAGSTRVTATATVAAPHTHSLGELGHR